MEDETEETAEAIKKRRAEMRQKRVQREAARALNGDRRKVKDNVAEFLLAKEVMEKGHDEIKSLSDLAEDKNKDTPYAIGYTGKGRPSRALGLTQRLREVIGAKAHLLEDYKEYCELSGLDAKTTTVRDCVVHNLLHWTLKGSAPHLKELLERLDGKVIQKVEATIDGKMSITDAMALVDLSEDDYEVTDA